VAAVAVHEKSLSRRAIEPVLRVRAMRLLQIITIRSFCSWSISCTHPASRSFEASSRLRPRAMAAHCASDAQVEKYLGAGSLQDRQTCLLRRAKPPVFRKVLSRVKAQGWKTMCAFTHTGGLHIQRWNTSDGIEPNYTLDEVLEVLAFAEAMGALGSRIAELANDAKMAGES